jgi:hypothetical protein
MQKSVLEANRNANCLQDCPKVKYRCSVPDTWLRVPGISAVFVVPTNYRHALLLCRARGGWARVVAAWSGRGRGVNIELSGLTQLAVRRADCTRGSDVPYTLCGVPEATFNSPITPLVYPSHLVPLFHSCSAFTESSRVPSVLFRQFRVPFGFPIAFFLSRSQNCTQNNVQRSVQSDNRVRCAS